MSRSTLVSLLAVLSLALASGCGAPRSAVSATAAPPAADTPAPGQTPAVTTVMPQPATAVIEVATPDTTRAGGRVSTPYPTVAISGEFLRGDDAIWPAYIPADIPPLDGDIYIVMPGTDRIRILYQAVSPQQFEAYIGELSRMGYALDYLYYVEEGKPDTSAERMQRGEFDAVDATMGAYALRIAYGANTATLDIDARSFSGAVAEAIAVHWPAELAGVPAPERCGLVRVDPAGQGGYHILCQRSDTEVDQDYEALLESAGFTEVSRLDLPDGTVASVELSDGTWRVNLQPSMVTYFSFDVAPLAPAAASVLWPPELAGRVPELTGGAVQSVMSLGDRGFMIQCEIPDYAALEEYLATLTASGFSETGRMDSDGRLIRVDYARDATELSMRISQMSASVLNVIIEITE